MLAGVIHLRNKCFSSSVEGPEISSVRKRLSFIVGTFLTLLLLSLPLYAQGSHTGGWKWPEEPQNIQVLSETLKNSTLRANMVGFTVALGVRCSYCHVGVEGEPLSTYDFPSDANPNKDRAREMLRMLDDINGHLIKIESSTVTKVDMWCHTCHRGISVPNSIWAILGDTYVANGLEASLNEYAELKEKYYGKGAYWFRPSVLNGIGYRAVRDGDTKGALKAFKLNAKEYPKDGNAWDSLAETYMTMGDNKKAKKYYKKSLKFSPNNQNARDMIKKMEESK